MLLPLGLVFLGSAPSPLGIVVDHLPASSGRYVGSPTLAILPDGRYVAAHDEFGPNADVKGDPVTDVFQSEDDGQTWQKIAVVRGAFWSTLFVFRRSLYMLGTDRQDGDVVIRRSEDGGKTWTEPNDSSSGLLRSGTYHGAPTPVVVANGRLWRAFERVDPSKKWGRSFAAGMLSAPIDADLLRATSWRTTNFLASDRQWNGRDMDGWLEGNAVVAPDGTLYNVLRVATRRLPEKAALVRIDSTGTQATFDPKQGFVQLPGGAKKFTIRFDPVSGLYWSIVSIAPQGSTVSPGDVRNVLGLVSSPDLRHWESRAVLLRGTDPKKQGFQYVDWQIAGDDLVAVCRTAYDDEEGGAHNYHDANYLTFHRIERFRSIGSSSPLVSVARSRRATPNAPRRPRP